jgi:hypothetical protein
MAQTNSTLTHLECGACGKTYEANQLLNLCTRVRQAAAGALRPERQRR